MSFDLSRELQRHQPPWWFRLSAWVRERNERGDEFVEVPGTPAEVESMLPTRTFTEQLDLLLQLVQKKSQSLGEIVRLDLEDTAPLVWVRDKAEVVALLMHLQGLKRVEPGAPGAQMVYGAVRLTTDGLLRLEEISKIDVLNDRIFVAMWFPSKNDEQATLMADAYRDGIAKAIEAAGYKPWRVDLAPLSGERIDASIMVEIRRARAVVADASGHRPSVTYEAGFAEGLGKPVIWTVHKKWMKGLPFDTRQFSHLEWETPEQLARDLRPRIEHRLGIRRR